MNVYIHNPSQDVSYSNHNLIDLYIDGNRISNTFYNMTKLNNVKNIKTISPQYNIPINDLLTKSNVKIIMKGHFDNNPDTDINYYVTILLNGEHIYTSQIIPFFGNIFPNYPEKEIILKDYGIYYNNIQSGFIANDIGIGYNNEINTIEPFVKSGNSYQNEKFKCLLVKKGDLEYRIHTLELGDNINIELIGPGHIKLN